MSLFWTSRTRAFLAPGLLIAGPEDRRRGTRPEQTTRVEFGATGDGPEWLGAVGALRSHLDSLARGARVAITVSNHWVKFQLIPWKESLSKAEEHAAFARHLFQQTYGEHAASWEICLPPFARRAARLAAALDQELLAALRATVGQAGHRLDGVEPYFAAAFNRWRTSPEASREGWFAAIEPGRACVGLMGRGEWQWIGSRRLSADLRDWREALKREQVHATAAGIDAGAALAGHVALDDIYPAAGAAARRAREPVQA